MIISLLNQKGGAGKSSLARALAVEFSKNNWSVHAADLDKAQHTFFKWAERRAEAAIEPPIESAVYGDPNAALKASENCDLLIIDGKAFADNHVLKIADKSDLIIFPVGISLDDLEPSIYLAMSLVKHGIPKSRFLFVVGKVPDNGEKEAMDTRSSIEAWGFKAARGWIPFKPTYSKAMDKGLAFTETPFKSLNSKADSIIQQIYDYAVEQIEALKESA